MSTPHGVSFTDIALQNDLDRCSNEELDGLGFGVIGSDAGSTLDVTLDHVLTLRIRPVKVKLRLLAAPGGSCRYVLVQRSV